MITSFIDTQATGSRIWKLRKEKGLTVERLSELLGFSGPRAIYKWRNGETLPTLDNLIVLAGVLETSIDDIIVTRETNVA